MKKLILICVLIFELFACKYDKQDANKNSNEITLAVFGGSGDNNGSVKNAMELFRSYLSKKINRPVKLYVTNDYTSVIEALHANKAQIGYLSPFSYVLAAQKKDIIPMVAIGEMGKPNIYHSIIFANKKSGVYNINDLKNKASNLSLSFSDPASTSGHLIPFAYLQSIDINPEKDFKQVVFSGSHAATVLAVTSNKIDIGCTTREYGTDLLVRKGLIKENDFSIIWESDPIVASPIVIRKDVNPELVSQIKNSYLKLNLEDTLVFNTLMRLYHVKTDNLTYMSIDDSLYNGVRKIANNIKDISLINNK